MWSTELWSSPAILAVLGTTLLLLAVFLVANGIGGWYDERTRRAGAAVRRGAEPPAGFGTFHGVAQNLDARSGGELVRREQTQVSLGRGASAAWQNRACVTTGRVFLLQLDDGAEIEVDARDCRLVGFPESSPGAYLAAPSRAPIRELVSRLSAGDAVWATGVLTRSSERGSGAYRSSLSRRQLRGSPRRAIELSLESPVARWNALAKAHKRGAYAALGSLALVHGVFFRAVDRILLEAPRELDATQDYLLRRASAASIAAGVTAFSVVVAVLLISLHRVRRAHRS